MLTPVRDIKLLPDSLPPSCTCAKCATVPFECRKNLAPCCAFCKYRYAGQIIALHKTLVNKVSKWVILTIRGVTRKGSDAFSVSVRMNILIRLEKVV